jgi:nucleoside-diphosphate kinase
MGETLTMERTFLALKPDAVQRGLIGEIISRLEKKGYKLIGLKLMHISRSQAETHYAEHVGKPFFTGLVDFMTSGPVVAMAWTGENVVAAMRQLMGATNPQNAAPGTIRGDYGVDFGRNLIHGSDSPESGDRELGIFFKPEELLPTDWAHSLTQHVYENPPKAASLV